MTIPDMTAPTTVRAAAGVTPRDRTGHRDVAWHRDVVVGFDLETTGVDPRQARIVTAAIVYHLPDGTIGPRSRRWLVDPGIPIPPAATAVHGVTTEDARRAGVPAAVAVPEILDALCEVWAEGLPLVVFNAAYDLTLMEAAARRVGCLPITLRPQWPASIIDPLVIDRFVDRYRKGKRTLSAAADHYRVPVTDAHSADGDAVMACLVARAIAEAYPDVGRAELAVLHSSQEQWSLEWAVRFQSFLRSRGRADAVVDGTWPLRSDW